MTANTPELNSVAALTGKSTSEVKGTMKETKTDKGDRLIEDEPAAVNGTNGEHLLRGAILLERSASRQSTKGEPLDDTFTKRVASPRLPPSLQTSDLRSERTARGRASKTSTPVVGTFAEAEAAETASANGHGNGSSNGTKVKRPARPRVKDHGLHDSLSPKGLPVKRSHKKSGSVASTFQGPATSTQQRLNNETDTTKSNTPSERDVSRLELGEDEEEELDGAEEDEERYCYCQGVSYGEMVACDKDDCPRQWFHLECIGLKSVPKSAKWYCDECKDVLAKKGKVGSNGGNGNGK